MKIPSNSLKIIHKSSPIIFSHFISVQLDHKHPISSFAGINGERKKRRRLLLRPPSETSSAGRKHAAPRRRTAPILSSEDVRQRLHLDRRRRCPWPSLRLQAHRMGHEPHDALLRRRRHLLLHDAPRLHSPEARRRRIL